MDFLKSNQEFQEKKRQFRIILIIFSFCVIIFTIAIISNGINWNEVLKMPRAGMVTFLIWVALAIPVLYLNIILLAKKFMFRIRTYFGQTISYEQWKENKRYFGLKYQDEFINYYKTLRDEIGDEQTVNRIIDFNFVKGDKLEHLLCSLEQPDFILHLHLWDFYDKLTFYYYPYYEKKTLLNFFNIKYKFVFVFSNSSLEHLKIDGVEQI